MARAHRDGLRKICGCKSTRWAKCPHPWHFAYKWNGVRYRFSLDRVLPEPVRLKGDAENEAIRIRAEIQAGTFTAPGAVPVPVAAAGPVLPTLTLAQLLDRYRTDHISVNRPGTLQNDVWQIGIITRTVLVLATGESRLFGEWCVSDIKASTVEQFSTIRRQAGVVATNRNLSLLRAAFAWGIRQEHVEATPFKRGGESVVRLTTETKRSRRLEPGEGDTLLAACNSTVRPLVEAALETACRRGELLSLQWKQVRLDARGELVLPAGKTKTKKERRVPISSRLRSILEMRRYDAEGKEHQPDAYVFGDPGTGQALRTFRRGWASAVLRAHGIKPQYIIKKVGQDRMIRTGVLTVECRDALKRIDLHFHDLRREGASRWLDSGVVPLSTIQQWLGHANIAQTSTYLQSQTIGQNDVMRRFEERQASLAPIGTAAGTSGSKGPRSAAMREKRQRKDSGHHQVQ